MGFIGGRLGYAVLRRIGQRKSRPRVDGTPYSGRGKLAALLGPSFLREISDRVVIDFGCGEGSEAIDLARHGARRVIGIDIQERFLATARARADQAGVAERCTFTTTTSERADVILSLDSFEHFSDPAGVLAAMRELLHPDGCIVVSFGPPWYHPLGGHLFSVFPWAHLIFTEAALIRWRSDFKTDGARRFHEVAGGLNQMTIARFEALIRDSNLVIREFEAVPIRPLRAIANRLTREFTTSIVRCKLVLP